MAATAHTSLAPRQPANPRYVARGRTRARRGFTFVATDLRGYGDSSKPETTRDHAPYSKRQMAQDQISVMRQLSLERFNVCGHDRGCRVAYRMALDHPERVLRPAVLDIACPRAETFSRADMMFGIGYWHRVLPCPAPRVAGAPHRDRPGLLLPVSRRERSHAFASEALEEHLRCFRDPRMVHAICEDYQAAATIDFAHDEADRREGRRITCPVLALWGWQGYLEEWHDVLGIWRGWTDKVRGRALESVHYLPEEALEEPHSELHAFFEAGQSASL